uniref:Septin-type G domain-containing protein n=1 Tax=Calidris pygmaea TaxID=425635 RepID=A0A8C3JW67_9CHAR
LLGHIHCWHLNKNLSLSAVENGEHCDFTILRNMLIRTHMQDLKDVTNNVHYENYRSRKLAAVTYNGVDNNKNKGQLTKSNLLKKKKNSLQICVSITEWLLLPVMFPAVALSLSRISRVLNVCSKYVRNLSQATIVPITLWGSW